MTHIVRNLFCFTAIVWCAVTLTACGKDDFEADFTGIAIMSMADGSDSQRLEQVCNGEKVKLSIAATAETPCELGIVRISGVSYAPEVYYCIDGQRVGMSRDENSFFAVDYEVKGLAPGQHTLSVEIPNMYGNIKYNIHVQSSTFEVVEYEGKILGVAIMDMAHGSTLQRVEQVHNGDIVTLSIGANAGQRCDLNIVHISGVSYAPEVYYCIDGQRVGMSRDENTFFAVPYEVKGLSAGQHTLSVDIPQMYHNIDYTVNVQSSTFEVVE